MVRRHSLGSGKNLEHFSMHSLFSSHILALPQLLNKVNMILHNGLNLYALCEMRFDA